MKYTIPISKEMVTASVTAPVSTKHAIKICRAINRKKFSNARNFITELIEKKRSLQGKYYTKTAEEILKLLDITEKNSFVKNIDTTNMELFISAHQGPKLLRGRRKRRFGLKLKMTHLQVILKQKKKEK